jgi:transcription antitermination protein NusB
MVKLTTARSLARILALQVLFEADSTDHPPEEILERRLSETPPRMEGTQLLGDQAFDLSDFLDELEDVVMVPPESAQYARRLVRGVSAHPAELDAIIAAAAPNWPMDQMAKVDKNILRLAIQEVQFDTDVPLKAAINEAVELGKRFGSESSSRFINGVLGTVAAHMDEHRGH